MSESQRVQPQRVNKYMYLAVNMNTALIVLAAFRR